MKLLFKDKESDLAVTENNLCMKYRAYKIYFAILIKGHHRFSTVRVRQTLDCFMVDDDYKILDMELAMHENTVLSNEEATQTIIVPTGTFTDINIGDKFTVIE